MTDKPDMIEIARRVAIRAHGCGGTGRPAAPPELIAYAERFAAGAGACLHGISGFSASDQALAMARLAGLGLIPGGIGDASATAYLFKGKGGISAVPNPRGRRALALAAGVSLSPIAIGRKDSLALTDDGYVHSVSINEDARPTTWADLRGVVVWAERITTGERIGHWVSSAEIATRKDKGGAGSWSTDAIGMALSKAIKILVDRGIIPQAPIPVISADTILTGPLALPPAPQRRIEAAPVVDPEPEPDDEPEGEVPPDDEAAPEPEPEAAPAPVVSIDDMNAALRDVNDLAADLAAEAECAPKIADDTIAKAFHAMTNAGKEYVVSDFREPKLFARLIINARKAQREADEAGYAQ